MPTPPSEYRYPCESCGGSLQFAPGQNVLICPYCGHEQHIPQGAHRAPARQQTGGAEGADVLLRDPSTGRALQWDAQHKSPELREIPLAQGLKLDANSDLTQVIRTLSCPNCGAKIEVDSDRHATDCPFCATPVVTDTGQTRQIKPQGVLPFVLAEEQARAAMEDWLGSLWFAPSGLTAYARRGRRMTGVYSPFWTFDAQTASQYSGMRGDAYYETVWVTQTVNGRTQRVQQQVRKIRWTPVSGQVSRHFNDVLVLASGSLPRKFSDGLTPWDLSHLVDYRPEYLVGFEAEGYTIPLADGHGIARQEMAGVIAMDVRRAIGGDAQQVSAINTRHSDESFKHILLPIWTAAYKYNGKSYRFTVNGQTGRVQGERPYSAWKIALAVLLALIVVAALLFAANETGYVQFDTGGGLSGGYSSGGYVIRGY
ncbi:MAG: zinc ribbon domain-containing protein [Paracoccus sp. (in: a-proteobacteria)]|uniref:zinc ribbon domain-containing protein n=1 Tax=Paracoccus sp. TaxID=267 RepID=UPI0026DFC0DE|nr:zinc ribbon domain-containing protein [Paracoccus sp. (in: a-proteobacteria)]MDO5621090.1 zinc ribbon domain-containing protein [Paracoccus sp. (in: a-proteobacteria)]